MGTLEESQERDRKSTEESVRDTMVNACLLLLRDEEVFQLLDLLELSTEGEFNSESMTAHVRRVIAAADGGEPTDRMAVWADYLSCLTEEMHVAAKDSRAWLENFITALVRPGVAAKNDITITRTVS